MTRLPYALKDHSTEGERNIFAYAFRYGDRMLEIAVSASGVSTLDRWQDGDRVEGRAT